MNKQLKQVVVAGMALLIGAVVLHGCASWRESSGGAAVMRPQLGVRVRVSPANKLGPGFDQGRAEALLVLSVKPSSPAELAGIVTGDVLLGVDGRPISNARDALPLMRQHRAGDTVRVTAWRGGTKREVSVVLQ